MLIATEIVDVRRFYTPWKLVSYAGLAWYFAILYVKAERLELSKAKKAELFNFMKETGNKEELCWRV